MTNDSKEVFHAASLFYSLLMTVRDEVEEI